MLSLETGRARRDGRAAHVGESDRVRPTQTVPRLSPTEWSARSSVWGARPGGRGNLRNRNRNRHVKTTTVLSSPLLVLGGGQRGGEVSCMVYGLYNV